MKTYRYANRVLRDHYANLDTSGRMKLARRLRTEYGYLRQLVHGSRRPSVDLARRIAKELGVTLADIRPDLKM